MVIDPTRTKSLRNEYARNLTVLFRDYWRRIKERLEERASPRSSDIYKKYFHAQEDFFDNDDEAGAFADEFDYLAGLIILNASLPLIDRFNRIAYMRGNDFARSVLGKKGIVVPELPLGVLDIAKLEHLRTYDFNLISGATDDIKNRIRIVLMDGVRTGKPISKIVPEIQNIFMKLPASEKKLWPNWKNLTQKQKMFLRADSIARSEIIRAHAAGALEEYKKVGIEMVELQNGDNPCEECADLAGNTYYLDDPEMPEIPVHPRCQCAWVAVMGE